MAKYINIGNAGFQKARNDEYIDKSELLGFVNRALNTEHNMLCLTRARRFGKSMAAKMLCAYYDWSCDSHSLFADLKIAADTTYTMHLNKYPVIYLDITYFTTTCRTIVDIVDVMEKALIADLQNVYPDLSISLDEPLIDALLRITEVHKQKFIMIVDEWDAIFRESESRQDVMRQYVDWLRSMYKTPLTDRVFAGVYMTGILPIVQYDTQSALNNFDELTMISPGALAGHFGFVDSEVQYLCDKYQMDMAEMKRWYDGYKVGDKDGIYNPYSVMSAIRKHSMESYWATTNAYESLKKYISLNYDGLKEAVVAMIAGESVGVNILRFTNDLQSMQSCDDALTSLIHLGYLSYDRATKTCYIPNYEVKQEFEKTILATDWTEVISALTQSATLLKKTLEGDAEYVAQAIEIIHEQNTSIVRYNDENALSSVLKLAYYMAQNQYLMISELPTGKGFADIVLLPKPLANVPAIVLELKWNKSAKTAIDQIKQKNYAGVLSQYSGEVVIAGINYDKKTKLHTAVIERVVQKNQGVNSWSSQGVDDQGLKEYSWSKKQQRILNFCTQERSLEDIAAHLNVGDRYYMKKKHIDPMLGVALLMTEPNSPNSPTQKYIIKK